jgi:excisionase family DNA binding protein
MAENFPEIMTIDETSRYLRVPLSSLYRLAQGGRIPCQKVGRHWRFRRKAIELWLGELQYHTPNTKLDYHNE